MNKSKRVYNVDNFFVPFEEQYKGLIDAMSRASATLKASCSEHEKAVCIRKLKKLIMEQEKSFICWNQDEKQISLCINKVKVAILNVEAEPDCLHMLSEALDGAVNCYKDIIVQNSLKSKIIRASEIIDRTFEMLAIYQGVVYEKIHEHIKDVIASQSDLYRFFQGCADKSEMIASLIDINTILSDDVLDRDDRTCMLSNAEKIGVCETPTEVIFKSCAMEVEELMNSIGNGSEKTITLVFKILLECYLASGK